MLTRISQKQFIEKIKKRKTERVGIINTLEKTLLKLRGYIFKQPKKGSSVILLLSGGLDSVVAWGILMEEYGLSVYPISFDTAEARSDKEKASIDYFSTYYEKRYPALFHTPLRVALDLTAMTLPIDTALEKLHPDVILENFAGKTELQPKMNVSLGGFIMLPSYAKLYGEYLNLTQNLQIRSIFCAVTASDGDVVPYQAFTALRSTMHNLCITTGDYRWQFSSVCLEKETGIYFDKSDLVKWACRHHIPLEHTWTCYHAKPFQCGGSDCLTCMVRQKAFAKAGVVDKTVYRSLADQRFLGRILYPFRPIIRGVKGQRNIVDSKI